MQSLNLYIKDRIRIDFDTIVLLDIFCQTDLILLFDLQKFLLCFRIGCIFCQILDLRKTCDPVFSDMLCYPVCKQWISMCKENKIPILVFDGRKPCGIVNAVEGRDVGTVIE